MGVRSTMGLFSSRGGRMIEEIVMFRPGVTSAPAEAASRQSAAFWQVQADHETLAQRVEIGVEA